MPDGRPFTLEPFWRFILKTVFRTGLVELLVLLPKGNGKTAVLAALAVFHLLVTPNAQCFIAAADTEQADELYRFAQHYIESPDHSLEGFLLVRASTRRIKSRRDQGFIRVLASDKTRAGGKKHSYNPTLAIIEELHAHENDNAYVALRSAAFKRGGMVLDISTAGHDPESTLGKLRTGFLSIGTEGGVVQTHMKIGRGGRPVRDPKKGRLTICRSKSDRNVMLEWACAEEDDLRDMKVVKLANPASWVTEDSLVDALEAPGITPWAFARYRANVWTLGFESWIPTGAWEELAEPSLSIPPGAGVFGAIDMSRYRDCAALVIVQPRPGYPAAVKNIRIWKSGGPDQPVPYEEVKAAIRQVDEEYRLLAMGFDPKYFDQAAEELSAEGIPMVQFAQSNERMAPAWGNLRIAILNKALRHDGDPELTAHVIAGKPKELGEDQFKVIKQSRNGPPIDGGVALAMAHQLAFFRPQKPKPFVEVIR